MSRSLLIENSLRIKKAYRKKALELHPDRNLSDVETSTKLFAEIQSAYEILSDPHERAWYDSHKDAILRNDASGTRGQYEHNVRVTTAEDIMKIYLNFNGNLEFSESPSGFFSIVGKIFAQLAREENIACEWQGRDEPDYPPFESSKDTCNDTIKAFYAHWSSFATAKDFSSKDIYRCSEAPDRRTRRLMEKENRRLREDGIREFNEAVRALVSFVKKRDPRHTPKAQTEDERQVMLRDMAAIQAAKSRAANQAKLSSNTGAEWTKTREANQGIESDDSQEAVQEQFDCVVCNKTFKSENQYKAHEKNKKHVKAVQLLQKQMAEEDAELGLDASSDEAGDRKVLDGTLPIIGDEPPFNGTETSHKAFHKEAEAEQLASARLDVSMNDPHGDLSRSSTDECRSDVKAQGWEQDQAQTKEEDPAPNFTTNNIDGKHKRGKAKEKRARKAAQDINRASNPEIEFKCMSCLAEFPSKTRLFKHIKDLGHAQPVPKSMSTRKGRGRK